MSIRAFLAAFSLAACGAIQSAGAVTVQYSTQVAFDAASGPLTTIDFEGVAAPGGFQQTDAAGGLTIGGVQFEAVGPTFIGVVDPGYSPAYDRGTGAVLYSNYATSMVITFGSAVKTVSALFGAIFRTGPTLSVSLSNGATFDVPLVLNGDWSFAGFISDAANISSLTISNVGGDYILIDNLSFGTTSLDVDTGVPAPAAAMLFAFGLAGFSAVRRRLI